MTDPFTGLGHMLAHHFMVRAFEAGTVIALACGLVGYFVVLRAQVFAGDAMSHVAFTGALAALAAGADLRLGLFVGCAAFGIAMAALAPRGRPDDVVIGNTFAWVLGLGTLFLTLYTTRSSDGSAGVSVLFGSIFGITSSQTTTAVIIAIAIVVVMAILARPLLYASVDEAVAAASGVPVRVIGIAFLAIVGVTAGEATQAVGSLLLLGLLAAPAAAAQRLTDRPWRAVAISIGWAVVSVWTGLTVSYAAPRLPPSFTILAVTTGGFLIVSAWSGRSSRGFNRHGLTID